MNEYLEGTFDNRKTKCREVWVNGELVCNLNSSSFEHLKLQNGVPANPIAFGSYSDNPDNIDQKIVSLTNELDEIKRLVSQVVPMCFDQDSNPDELLEKLLLLCQTNE
jgi:hypothetical protein